MKRLFCVLLLVSAGFAAGENPFNAPTPKPEFADVQDASLYLPMKDGTRIALEVILPKGVAPDRKLPALMRITRYGRMPTDGSIPAQFKLFPSYGFAYILVDERGTGASFGNVRYGKATLGDIREVVDWIVKQPWSNGRVGAFGTSYEGTTAELLAAIDHPAVRAVAPLYSDFDYYTDLLYPGGVFNEFLIKTWGELTAEMDAGAAAKPVDGDTDRSMLKQALAEHKRNFDVYQASSKAEFSDSSVTGLIGTWNDMSVVGLSQELEKTRVPMMIFASWLDAATVQGTLRRFRNFANVQRVFIGDWNHGGGRGADPFLPPGQKGARGQAMELLRFFKHYLDDAPDQTSSERRLYYYTAGESEWHSTAEWPIPGLGVLTYHLESDRSLGVEARTGKVTTDVPVTSTGDTNRWSSQVTGGDITYANVMDKLGSLPAFTGPALETATEITGQPVLRLHMTSDHADPTVLALLTAIDPNGKAYYITEGYLRLKLRKIDAGKQTLHSYKQGDAQDVPEGQEFEAEMTLFPISVVLPKGYRLRLALASGDTPELRTTGAFKADIFASSKLELPMRARPDTSGSPKKGN